MPRHLAKQPPQSPQPPQQSLLSLLPTQVSGNAVLLAVVLFFSAERPFPIIHICCGLPVTGNDIFIYKLRNCAWDVLGFFKQSSLIAGIHSLGNKLKIELSFKLKKLKTVFTTINI